LKNELKIKIEVNGASKYKLECEGSKTDTLDIAIDALQKVREKLCYIAPE